MTVGLSCVRVTFWAIRTHKGMSPMFCKTIYRSRAIDHSGLAQLELIIDTGNHVHG